MAIFFQKNKITSFGLFEQINTKIIYSRPRKQIRKFKAIMILKDTINQASLQLKKNYIKSHLLDAEVILSSIMKVDREFLQLRDKLYISKNPLKSLTFIFIVCGCVSSSTIYGFG